MEAQEFGEMMEHVDEVNFALDGLGKGQPARIRRASLLSLLSISATSAQRRLLRSQGMAKTILDAVLDLSLDDSPSNLAAAALCYILGSDAQDEHLLESPTCIRFLLKLLRSSASITPDDKVPSIGSKLLALRRDTGRLGDQSKSSDSNSNAIVSKVQEILLSCKALLLKNKDGDGMGRPELSSKWIALLTIEKGCVSTVSLEDSSGTVRRVGGNFKEKLRELGGLDAVFGIAVDCLSIMEGWSRNRVPFLHHLKDNVALKTMLLLLKCLKIMENATFLSKDNQDHLLGMKLKLDGDARCLSFTDLVICLIKILSGLSMLQSSPISSNSQQQYHLDKAGFGLEVRVKEDQQGDPYWISSSNSSRSCCSMEDSRLNSVEESQKSQRFLSPISSSETTSTFGAEDCLVKDNKSSTSGSCNGMSSGSKKETARSAGILKKMSLGLGKRPVVTEKSKCITIEDSQDPFAFDEYEFEQSKWNSLSRGKRVPRSRESVTKVRELKDECQLPFVARPREPSNWDGCHSCEIASSSVVEDERSGLLADCLLAAVKVLMNLTNDNHIGCKQIAACGGLETLCSLIIRHFPSFSTPSSPSGWTEDSNLPSNSSGKLEYPNDKHFTEQELDFLVAILGLLVNLVEKDSLNRSRLAAATVSLPSSGESEGTTSQRDVIPLLCSIFMANQGAGEMGGEEMLSPSDDEATEAAVLQGEREAEKMIIEAYAALLLAFLSTESKNVREAIACHLPDHNLEVLVPVLERFVAFHLTLNMISPETHSAVTEVIESCRGI
ncbi:hypothetical protein Syun_027365 [Stephania yunnanensis]|uniref:WAPL domain-containing protein n=1 Tax=Stephania yunnanensis TaxID=152371 RepID=A0AAP0EPB9_9MAGN